MSPSKLKKVKELLFEGCQKVEQCLKVSILPAPCWGGWAGWAGLASAGWAGLALAGRAAGLWAGWTGSAGWAELGWAGSG